VHWLNAFMVASTLPFGPHTATGPGMDVQCVNRTTVRTVSEVDFDREAGGWTTGSFFTDLYVVNYQ
jgi:hypothetical protein